jgi:hypothetical protein
MILLDQRVSDLVRGYDRVSQADLRLQTEWRQHLLQHYASRRDKHASAFSEYVEKIRVLNPQLSTIAFVPLAMLIGGLVVTIVGVLLNVYWGTELTWGIGGVSLLIAGAIGIGLPIILWLWQVKLAKPPPPVHPLQEDLWSRLTPQWRAKLHGKLPVAILQRGNAGIYSFVKHLETLPVDSMYVLYTLQRKDGEDGEVVVAGARGVWAFAVKDWSGRVSWRDGEWLHEQFDPRRDAWVRVEEPPPDQEWQRIASQVSNTLVTRVPDLVKQIPAIAQIRGGVVFTNPKAIYEVPSSCPARWGETDSWDREISSAPIVQGLDDRAVFSLLDALLEQQREINGDAATVSMSVYATKIIRQAETRLSGWMEN